MTLSEEYNSQGEEQSSDASQRGYPVSIVFHGSNLYRNSLYDLDGFYLQDCYGRHHNVFRKSFAEALNNKVIRVVHKVSPGYRYFVTSTEQYNAFCKIREDGWSSPIPGIRFHLYDDEDCMYASDHFKGAILCFE